MTSQTHLIRAVTTLKKDRAIPRRHRWLDQWLVAKGEPLKKLVDKTIKFVDHDEQCSERRKRKRSQAARKLHERQVEGLVANLAYAVLIPPDTGRLAINTRNEASGLTRYDCRAFAPKTLRANIGRLYMLKVLDRQRPKAMRGEKASIAPTEWFARKVREHGVTLADFGRDEEEELIILNLKTRGAFDAFSTTKPITTSERVNYPNSRKVDALRMRMRQINRLLREADISFIEDGGPLVDPYDRSMRRMFLMRDDKEKPTFDQSGRLYGGFWQYLKSERRKGIRINGEPIAILDYSTMFTRLAYAYLKVLQPGGDLYAIPGLEDYRNGVKLVMNCFLFDQGPRRSWPPELKLGDDDRGSSGGDARLPAGWNVARTKKAILAKHPALAPALGKGLGYHLMFLESEILMKVLEQLGNQGIVGLGLHDGVFVPLSRGPEAKEVMEDVPLTLLGCKLPVTLKSVVEV